MAPPGYTSKKTSTSGGPPGTSSGKSREDIGRELDREITRREYFKGRPDISDDRLDRRLTQAQKEKNFISTLKPVEGTGGTLLQEQAPVFNPMTGKYERTTLADKRIELANKYGPTLGEIASDMGYAVGSMAKGAGDILTSGSFGVVSIIKNIANYALDKANKGFDKLNDVQKEIFENPDKYPYASKVPQVEAVNNSRELALEADRDALGLELDTLMAEREFRYNNPTVDMRKPTIEEMRTMPITQSGIFPAEEVKEAASYRFNPEYLEEQKRLLDELNVMPTVEELQPKEKSELGILDLLNPFDEVPIQMGINEMINPEQVDIEEFKKQNQQGFNIVPEAGAAEMGTQVTDYNNPGNLKFANQASAIQGQTYGPGYAVFPTAEAGLEALRNDLTAKVNRSNKVEDIIGQYAPRSDNPESFDNYLGFVKDRVGDTVEPNEINDLMKSIIQFENKPDIAGQYLPMVANGGMIDNQLKSLQNGLQNMYNGIPSVKRR